MMRHTDDAHEPDAMKQSDDASGPDDPPVGRLFMKRRTDRCLTSEKKGYAGFKWGNIKMRGQTN